MSGRSHLMLLDVGGIVLENYCLALFQQMSGRRELFFRDFCGFRVCILSWSVYSRERMPESTPAVQRELVPVRNR